MKITNKIKNRLEYLRGEIQAERISYGEIAELVSLAQFIEAGDVLLLEWAGVSEGKKQKARGQKGQGELLCTRRGCYAPQVEEGEFCQNHIN